MKTFKLVFSGDILPGHEPERVKTQLAAMLKVPPEKSARLFSGKDVILKTGLDETRVDAYRRKLATMGVGVRAVAETAPESAVKTEASALVSRPADSAPEASTMALAPVAHETKDAAASPLQVEPVSEPVPETQCPECGHTQPKRTLCVQCGADMPRIRAAQAAAAEEARRPPAPGRGVQDRESDAAQEVERPGYLGLSFEGRFGRRSYFVGNFLVMLVVALLAFAGALAGSGIGFLLMIPALIVGFLMILRVTVLRFHDFNWSGWWSLLLFVPGVGVVASLLLLFMPGSTGSNDHGYRPSPTPWLHAGLLILAMVVASAVMLPVALKSYAAYVERVQQAQSAIR